LFRRTVPTLPRVTFQPFAGLHDFFPGFHMTKPRGKNIPISPFRGLVIDLMHFTQKVPSVSIDRRMNLAVLAEARSRCFPKPTWTALFIKAYSIVAARDPALRQSYMEFPWPRIYEHPKNIVTLNVSRNVNGENVVLQD